jgi:hypothetical protein
MAYLVIFSMWKNWDETKVFGEKLLLVFESKILVDFFDAMQDILVRCLCNHTKLLVLVFSSFQIFLFVMAYLVIFSMWKNWDETKVFGEKLLI